MIVEKYSDKYYADVVVLIENFYTEVLYAYQSATVTEALNSAIEKNKEYAYLLIVDGKCEGVIAGMAVYSPLNNTKVYQEMIWYVNKPFRKYGVFLLNKVMEILKVEGFVSVVMSLMVNSKTDKIARLYERMGFNKFELHFLKNI